MKRGYLVFFAVAASCLFFACQPAYADKVHGRIKSVDTAASIVDIWGVKVGAQKAHIRDESNAEVPLSSFSAGDFVKAEGDFSDDGKFSAYSIKRTAPDADQINGRIEQIDAYSRDVVVWGIRINVPKDVCIKGYNDMQIPFGGLAAGNYVECKGKWLADMAFAADNVEIGQEGSYL